MSNSSELETAAGSVPASGARFQPFPFTPTSRRDLMETHDCHFKPLVIASMTLLNIAGKNKLLVLKWPMTKCEVPRSTCLSVLDKEKYLIFATHVHTLYYSVYWWRRTACQVMRRTCRSSACRLLNTRQRVVEESRTSHGDTSRTTHTMRVILYKVKFSRKKGWFPATTKPMPHMRLTAYL